MNAESTTIHCRFPTPARPRTRVAADATMQIRNQSANHRSKAGVAALGLVPTPMKKTSNATVASISDNHPSTLRGLIAGRCLRRSTQTQKINAGCASIATQIRPSTAVPKSLPLLRITTFLESRCFRQLRLGLRIGNTNLNMNLRQSLAMGATLERMIMKILWMPILATALASTLTA